ncbi:uracil-DNA glycosylase [Desulforhopalus singaporensis]|uniref:Uracil-DNA glycosylase n=1 Tax=Desulforhopalus singaporensis TaxID=91360 RepID=A0A1H0PHB7_9BACT|nr:uracil-DNA glycosylase [Desulforhopalus singaporensis]SDP04068.1 Uracil-DNA glycosylase [Desulforhopalus singaporensis]
MAERAVNNGKEGPLWEEIVPLMKEGFHRELVRKAYDTVHGGGKVFPERQNVFASMRQTSISSTKVVILGQDPYFNEHPGVGPEAHGLCFSVRTGCPVPPSLRNILLEVNNSIYGGKQVSVDTDLTRWALQGVLLLNASLTVEKKRPNSHVKLGWHVLTDNIIETVNQVKKNVVFMLWGAFAQKKAPLIDGNKHLILTTSHPSPLSAHRGFLGSDVFVKCNEYLKAHGMQPISW